MDGLEHLKNSPASQLLKQLDTPLSITTKIATQFDWVFNTGPLLTAKKAAHQDWSRDISSIAAAWNTVQAAQAFDTTSLARTIEATQRDLAREVASIATSWKSVEQAWALHASPIEKAIEGIRWDSIRETASMATAWKTAQEVWAIDTAPIAATLKAAEECYTRILPAWAGSISLEQIEPPKVILDPTTQIKLRDISSSNKPFSDYGMAESYDLLCEFEQGLRDFIHQRMSAAFGSCWENSRIPRDMYKRWQEKREKALGSGESPGRLIDYADFTDYVTVITRKDNWGQLFKSCFGRAQFVQESMYRLHPIRVCTMHARVLPVDMQLVLQSEIMLLSRRMWN